jgi:hypothetical protein
MKTQILGIVLALFMLPNLGYPKPDQAGRIPDHIRSRGDLYIIKKVGRDYFQKNYLFRIEESSKYPYDGGGYIYRLMYEYLPFKRIGEDQARISVRIIDKLGIMPSDQYVACGTIGNTCEPRITKDQAIKIAAAKSRLIPLNKKNARAVFITPRDDRSGLTWTWETYFPQKTGSECYSDIVVRVDAVSGLASEARTRQSCH